MPFATNGAVQIFHETFGDPNDPTLVLVNGLGSQCINFRSEWCERFVAKGYQVVRMDNRDVGLANLKGKKLVYAKTGCRDGDFLDNAMLDGELRTEGYFGALIDKPDVAGAVLTVRDYKAADAVFAPSSQARGLTRVYEAGPVPNPGFVALKSHPAAFLDGVKEAVLSYGSGGGIDGWRAAAPGAYSALGARLAGRSKRLVFAPPEIVRLDDADVLVLPASRWDQATVKQHFWEPSPAAGSTPAATQP